MINLTLANSHILFPLHNVRTVLKAKRLKSKREDTLNLNFREALNSIFSNDFLLDVTSCLSAQHARFCVCFSAVIEDCHSGLQDE